MTRLDAEIAAQQAALDRLGEKWKGTASDAAQAHAKAMLTRQISLKNQLAKTQAALSSAGTNLTALRTEILNMVKQAISVGGLVAGDGTVTPSPFSSLLTPQVAKKYTDILHGLLTQFDRIDQATAAEIQANSGEAGTGAASQAGIGGEDSPYKWTDKDLYRGNPSSADIGQNALGDCYLVAAMGALADADPERIKNKISFNPETGEFDVTLWDGNEWRHVPVTQADIDANMAAQGGSGLDTDDPTQINHQGALWPAVIESAYGKLKAPGQNLLPGIGQGGQTSAAMEALTGNRGTSIDPSHEWYRTLNIDQQISQALQTHQPVVLSTPGNPGGTGLVGNHAYTVIGITGTGSEAQVTVRNPWDVDDKVKTVRLGDLVGSGWSGATGDGPVGNVNIGQL
ncbi:C2 family cysteine protease [Mycolicibacterium sp. HK-90]|uniref:C2 family cysteine protease n=1 Tax=Mycolicibacterium sp. HK-90 TaxID=3056937 RepID=UPI0026585AF6|nr:C2 family cysteine protease [Mycolicibacterium sp. HK-90]WKG02335.1 C2 family cysteine protease [Mycolicibacterium sp. HK-90]